MSSKPYLYWWYGAVLVLLVALTALIMIVDIAGQERDKSGFWLVAVPFVVIFIVQLVGLGLVGWWLLKKVKEWNTPAMVISAIIVPLPSALLVVMAAEKLHRPINNVGNPTPFYLFATLCILSGVIVYNDLKYRNPKRRAVV